MASVYILGAGAMGSLWATHLHQAFKQQTKNTVGFLSTRAKAASHLEFSLNSPFLSDKQTVFKIKLDIALPADIQATDQDPALILLCTKSYHALNAVLALKPFLNKNCSLVLFQNGLGSQHQVLEAIPDIPVFAAVSTEGVNRKADGLFIHAGKGLNRIGPLNQSALQDECFKICMDALTHPGLKTQAVPDIWPALWEKLAINCAINPFTAILNCTNGEIKDSAIFHENWPELKQELSAMLELAGVQSNPDKLEASVFKVIEDTGSNISSMLQDARARRQTEIADINGFAARYLNKHGLPHKVNADMYQRILDQEDS